MVNRADERVVTKWPSDPGARHVLLAYVQRRNANSPNSLVGYRIDFRGADLRGLDLSEAYLLLAELDGVNLSAVDLYAANLNGASLRRADLTDARLPKAQAVKCDARDGIFVRADLFRADFTDANLRGADLRHATLSATDLTRADLTGADLRECRFGPTPTYAVEACLTDARIAGATGEFTGPVWVGDTVLTGDRLQAWFTANGAPGVGVV